MMGFFYALVIALGLICVLIGLFGYAIAYLSRFEEDD